MSVDKSNATENIERVERAVSLAIKTLSAENIPAIIWSPRDLWGLEVVGGHVIETDEEIWEAWTPMRMDTLTDLHGDDWDRLVSVVEDALTEAGRR